VEAVDVLDKLWQLQLSYATSTTSSSSSEGTLRGLVVAGPFRRALEIFPINLMAERDSASDSAGGA